MMVKLYNENPNTRIIRKITETLHDGGIIIFPTDTVYGIGCELTNQKAVDKVARFKGVKVENVKFSFICSDLSHLSDYTQPIPNTVFKLMKNHLPGPFTFILEANKNVPRYFKGKKKTVGIRVPDNAIIRSIVEELGNPILSTSLHDEDTILEYVTDPELIYERFKEIADIIIDGGAGGLIPSTVVDCIGKVPEIIRQGKGEIVI
jgi:tRNA threonylcarbamoyl adenosine modification protein (Sua5/YciO/YrdC/YwlC family)